jgi:hypothetical protein
VFHAVAYRAKNRDHFLAGIDEFMDAVTVLPPGEWDTTIRIEPPSRVPSQEPRKNPDKPPEREEDPDVEELKALQSQGLESCIFNILVQKSLGYAYGFICIVL